MWLHESPPAPADDDLSDPRLILRDGTVASVRGAMPRDQTALRSFFHGLSPASRHDRFMGSGEAADAVVDRFCESNPSRLFSLIALREMDGSDRIIAVATYITSSPTSAEVVFAVADAFQGRGIATLLLERLAAIASAAGFSSFTAETLVSNDAMLDVFHDSGFEINSRTLLGSVQLELSLEPSAAAVRAAEVRRRNATINSLRPILAPKSVVVIGASADRPNIGRRILQALTSGGFTGVLHAVHPHASDILGVPAASTARDLPRGVDLAVVAVPAASVLRTVDDCVASGVKAVVVVSAGFAEVGPEGQRLQEALVSKVRNSGMRMVGPNCMGLLNLAPDVRMNASFSPVAPAFGGVAFSSQSGALGIAILALAEARGVGLSAFVSVGNKGDVSSNDLLEYWDADPATRVILLYLESFGNPRRFARLARRIARSKPIVALKAGRTPAGRQAAGSHTAALAARGEAVDAVFDQAGIIRAETVDEMFDIAACLDSQPLPRSRRVAILTNGGGPGILAADACEAAALHVATLSSPTAASLASFLPSAASVHNPIDMVASAGPDEYRQAVHTLMCADEVDSLIVIVTPIDPTATVSIWKQIEVGVREARAAGATGKPVIACMMTEAREAARQPGGSAAGETIPVCTFPENAVRALGKISAYAAWRAIPAGLLWTFDDIRPDEARSVCRQALAARGDGWLGPDEVQKVLAAFGVVTASAALAHSATDAAAIGARLGYPVAAKLVSRTLQHKTELGLVRTNVADERALRAGVDELLAKGRALVAESDIDGVLIQRMVGGGIETLIGVAADPSFGPLVGFGLGGTNVEIFGDVHFRVAPLTDRDARELVNEPRGARLLHGYRGRPPGDIPALQEMLLRVSRLADEVREIGELDLNPVLVLPEGRGVVTVDARIHVRALPVVS